MTGDILAAHYWKNNGELIADVARLDYLTADMVTLDVTYGRGVFWKVWRPDRLVTMSYPEDADRKPADIDGNFLALPFRTGSFDAVIYDPPYMCASTDTEILTDRGWLHHGEVKVGDQAWTLDHERGRAEWQPIEAVHIYPAERRPMLSMRGRSHSSLTTLDHRWPVLVGRGRKRAWTTSRCFTASHVVPVAAAPTELPRHRTYSDAFVELVAWFWTEGTIDGNYGNVCQSHVVNDHHCAAIRTAFTTEYGPDHGPFPRTGRSTDGVPRWRETVDGHKTVWWFSADIGRRFQEVAPNRVVSMDFLRSLTSRQLVLFVERSLDADGCREGGSIRLNQADFARAEAFQIAATMAGLATTIATNASGDTVVRVRRRRVFKPRRNSPTVVEHDGPVWCVTTANGTWMARRDGTAYFTGNSKGTPHVPKGGGRGFSEMDQRYGVGSKGREAIWALMSGGLTECIRVTKPGGRLVTKAGRGIDGGKLWRGDDTLVRYGEDHLGLTVVAQFIMLTRPRSQKHRGPQKTPRSNFSTLTVWDVPTVEEDAKTAQAALFAAETENPC